MKPSTNYVAKILTTPTEICSSSETRTSLTFSTGFNSVFIGTSPKIAIGEGIFVSSQLPLIRLCGCHQGDWIRKQLWAISPVGVTQVYVIEGFEPPIEQMLAAHILGGRTYG